MKPKHEFTRCEYCDELIELISPPTNEQYEQGLIFINELSSILLPHDIAEKNGGMAHAKSIDGHYCNLTCLQNKLREILGYPKVGIRKA